jgi:hypothetical protein
MGVGRAGLAATGWKPMRSYVMPHYSVSLVAVGTRNSRQEHFERSLDTPGSNVA